MRRSKEVTIHSRTPIPHHRRRHAITNLIPQCAWSLHPSIATITTGAQSRTTPDTIATIADTGRATIPPAIMVGMVVVVATAGDPCVLAQALPVPGNLCTYLHRCGTSRHIAGIQAAAQTQGIKHILFNCRVELLQHRQG